MKASIRAQVMQRARNTCEFCRCLEDYSTGLFAVEHIHPTARGGSDDLSNLAWACAPCNAAKYDFIEATDPETGQIAPLFHPRRDEWNDHFRWSADKLLIEAKTATGRATLVRLDLNRRQNINLRGVLLHFGLHPPADAG